MTLVARWVLAGGALLVASGCAAVTLRHPETGAVTRCGSQPIPLWYGPQGASASVAAERECVERYRQQGYVTVRE